MFKDNVTLHYLLPVILCAIYYTPVQLVEGGHTGITLSVRLSGFGVFLSHLSMNLSQMLYTSLSSYGIVHL